MNIKQLKEKIKDLDEDMDVVIEKDDTEFSISPAEAAQIRRVKFSEGRRPGPVAYVKCLVISDSL